MATRRVAPIAVAQMKAAQIPKPGADFQIVEREVPEPSEGQVRIKVQACGICRSDVLTVEGSWPGIQVVAAGVEVSEIFHLGPNGPVPGPDPQHGTYRSLAVFSDPDGNSWLLQETTTRLPGRIDTGVTSFSSTSDLASALRRAEAAHGEHEKRTGQRDTNWPEWYAAYMVAEQSGEKLPQ
jgi:hypothetical protein